MLLTGYVRQRTYDVFGFRQEFRISPALRLLRGIINSPRFGKMVMTYRGFKISISTGVFPLQASYAIHPVGEENSAPVVSGTLLGAFATLDAAFDAAVISARSWIDEQEVALTQRSSS